MTTSGRAVASSAWRRSRWKNWAARRAVGDADVVLRRELEEALEARARVLGAVALVPVRQQKRQARGLLPLRAARDDELVDDDLRAVDEVAELRLPEDERVGRGDRVAVLEAERRELGERRVVDLERRGRGRQVPGAACASRPVTGSWSTAWRCENVPRSVSWPESRIGNPLLEERRERERLGVAPVDPALARAPRAGARAGARASGSPRSPRGTRSSCSSSSRQAVGRHGGDDRVARVRPRLLLDRRERRGRERSSGARRGPCGAPRACGRAASRPRPRRARPSATSRGRVGLADRRLPLDALGLERLRVRRLVLLVVPEAAVADEVDDDVVAELRAVGEREPDRGQRGLGIVGVHVHDRARRSPWRGRSSTASSALRRGRS